MRRARVGSQVFAGLAVVAALLGCSKENEINQDNSVGGTISPAGGIVEGPAGCGAVRIPGGALTEDTTIGIALAGPTDYPALPSGYDISGSVCAFTPHGLQFLSPAIVSLPRGTGTTLLRAEEGGAWSPQPTQINGTTLAASVTGFSFFVAASEGTGPEGGDGCGGRAPIAGAPTATLSGLSGVITNEGTGESVDLATVQDAYAESWGNGVVLVFTPYAAACGHVQDGLVKQGTRLGVITLSSFAGTLASGPLTVEELGTSIGSSCSTLGPTGTDEFGGNSVSGDTSLGMTLTAVDATHVAGSFNFPTTTGSRLQGTFDIPVCEALPGLEPARCCVP